MPATKQGRWFGRKMAPSERIRVLTASASQINLSDRAEARRQRALRQGWQLSAWAYWNSIPELRYATSFLGNCASRMRLFPAAYAVGETDEPVALSELENVPEPVLAACNQAMLDLGNGRLALAEMMKSLSVNMSTAGEAFILGQEDPQTGNQDWKIRSVSEVIIYDDQWKLREVPMDPQGILGWVTLDPALTVGSRMWISHPEYRILSDCPMRALMDTCEALLILRRTIRATGRSRLAQRNVLLLPNEVSIKVPDDDNDDPEAEDWFGYFSQAMMEPINEEGTAQSVVPIVLQIPGDYIEKVRLLDMASEFDEWSIKVRDELLGNLSSGLDLPKGIIEGTLDANHWSAFYIGDDTFRHHVEPHVITLADCLTGGYLRPYLEDALEPELAEVWAKRCLIWYDPTELVTHPDRSADAAAAHTAMVISDKTLRDAYGFDDHDAPSVEELEFRQFQHLRNLPLNLLMEYARRTDPSLIVPPITVAGTVPGIKPGAVDTGPPVVAPAPVGATPTGQTPAPAPPAPATPDVTQPVQHEPPGLTASAAQDRISQRLTAIDQDLRARLQIAANAAMLRQLEKAGGRLRSKVAKDESLRTKIALTRNEHVASVLGEPLVSSLGLSALSLMGGAWDALKAQFLSWTGSAQKQAVANAARLAGLDEDDASVLAAEAQMSKGLDSGWAILETSLDDLAHSLLYDPRAEADLSAFNPDTLVPTGTIRAALAIAGGMEPTEVNLVRTKNGLQEVAAPFQAGQIGTGQTVQNLITSNGPQIAGYTWQHGPTADPFEPHLDLDGVAFASFDDPVLANDSDFPDNADYFPGDHAGCLTADAIVSGPRATSATLRDWQGEMVEVRFASGQLFTATPNHPVLTPHGWVAVGELDEGDEVVRCVDDQGITDLVPNGYQVPTRIDEVADALGVARGVVSGRVKVSPEDFHGDGSGSEVAIVRTDGDLRRRVDTALSEPSGEPSFSGADPPVRVGLTGDGATAASLKAVGDPALGLVGIGGAGLEPLGIGLGHEQAAGLSGAATMDLRIVQPVLDGAAVDAERLGEGILGLASYVACDKVCGVKRYPFVGHVFNLDTRVGWYIADGIMTHNCSCDWVITYTTATSGQE